MGSIQDNSTKRSSNVKNIVTSLLTFGNEHSPPLMVVGDIEACLIMFFNNFLNLSITYSLLTEVMQFEPSFVMTRVIPAMGVSVFIGSVFYWWQARRKSITERREDVTALPFGISTPTVFAFVFFILLPEKFGIHPPGVDGKESAFMAGIFANFWAGVVEGLTALYGNLVRKYFPNQALIASLTGIAIALIATGSLYEVFTYPALAMIPLFLFLFSTSSRVEIKFPKLHKKLPQLSFPWGIVIIGVGIALAWSLFGLGFRNQVHFPQASIQLGFYYPVPAFAEMINGFKSGLKYTAIMLPLAVINGIGSLQNLVSAKNKGDNFDTPSSLLVNGFSTAISALFGAIFPTSLFIGHPTFKELGARSFYMLLQGILILICSSFGLIQVFLKFMPTTIVLPILIFVGYQMTVEGFYSDDHLGPEKSENPRRHHIAIAIGLAPALANLSVQAATTALQVAGIPLIQVFDKFVSAGYFLPGAIALSQGFLLTSMLYAAVIIFWTDRLWFKSALILLVLAILSWVGVIHAFQITPGGVENLFVGQHGTWIAAPGFTLSYLALALFMLVISFVSSVFGVWKQGTLEDRDGCYQWTYGEKDYQEMQDSTTPNGEQEDLTIAYQ